MSLMKLEEFRSGLLRCYLSGVSAKQLAHDLHKPEQWIQQQLAREVKDIEDAATAEANALNRLQ